MKNIVIGGLLTLLLFTPAQPQAAQENDDEFTLAVFPRRGAENTRIMYTPLINGLSQYLNRKVTLVTSHDFASFWEKVTQQAYDIVHYNQYHYVRSHKDYGYQVFAQNVEFGHAKIAGAILVRKDSGIDSLQELKGKKIAFGGGRRAMMAYITTTYLLRNAGLNRGDYFEQFALNPPKACIAVYYHQAAAAGAGNHVLELPAIKKQINVDEMKYLAVSEEMAHLPWAFKQTMPLSLRQKIRDYMVNLEQHDEGKKILAAARLTRLIPAADSDYDLHRKIIKTVLNEDL